jgi:hypothetical protein
MTPKIRKRIPVLRVRAKVDAIVQNRFETFILVAPNIYMVVQDDAGQLLAKAPPHKVRFARVDFKPLFQCDHAHLNLEAPSR